MIDFASAVIGALVGLTVYVSCASIMRSIEEAYAVKPRRNKGVWDRDFTARNRLGED